MSLHRASVRLVIRLGAGTAMYAVVVTRDLSIAVKVDVRV